MLADQPTELADVLAHAPVDDLPRSEPPAPMADWLRWCQTPGVSVAVIEHGEVTDNWCAGVTTLAPGGDGPDPVTPRTLFQAGSVSKPVAAACALRLVAEGVLDLDDDVNESLRSWRVPAVGGWQPRVTVRQLLSHTAGTTVHGYAGYPAGGQVPTLVDVLEGRGNSLPVRITSVPGLQFSYSGGGYCVLQQLLIDVTGLDFPALADELVLRPAGMRDSTYAQPLPEWRAVDAASGHLPGPSVVPGRWHTYPEMAAAGLWSTPTDLARFFCAIAASRTGAPRTLLPPHLAEQMTTSMAGNVAYGLGLRLPDDGEPPSIGHGGTDEGYRTFAMLYDTGQGAVVMANSERGDALIEQAVLPALARHRTPPTDPAEPARPADEPMPADEATPAALAGHYRWERGELEVRALGDGLALVVDGQRPFPLLHRGDGSWRSPGLRVDVRFRAGAETAADPTLVLCQHAPYTVDIEATRFAAAQSTATPALRR